MYTTGLPLLQVPLMRHIALILAIALVGPALEADQAGQKAGVQDRATANQIGADGPFQLTVDSIMRGPDLVGYAPTNLRWSGDSQKLFFEWREPKEKEASTYVV